MSLPRGRPVPQSYRREPDLVPPDAAAEGALAARVLRGDADALGTLYTAFAPAAYAAAYRLLGERSDAEDVTQELFVRLPQLLAAWDPGKGTIGPWLRRVAVRHALMRLRSGARKREVSVGAVAELLATRTDEPHDRLSIAAALRRLPDEQRVVFLLKEVEGYPHAEIAILLEISVRNSEVRLFRARQALRAHLGSCR